MGRHQAWACYRELGAELRKRREKAELSSFAVADTAGWNRPRVSRIESGHIGTQRGGRDPLPGHLRRFRAGDKDLIRLCEDAERQLGYWRSAQSESVSSLVFHESTATRSISYESLLVPGLLQTPAYARARSAHRATTPEEILPELRAVALDEGQSRKFTADLADEYDRGSRKRHADIYQLEEEHL